MIVSVDLHMTGKELAKEYAYLNLEEQAEFFNRNLLKQADWNHGCALVLMKGMATHLDPDGIEFIEKLYSAVQDRKENEKQEAKAESNLLDPRQYRSDSKA